MNTLYLRNVITEGPDKGYGYAVEPTMEQPDWPGFYETDAHIIDHYEHKKILWEQHLASLPGILVRRSYVATHKVGFLPDDWEEGYEIRPKADWTGWELCSEEMYRVTHHSPRRKIILPRSSNVENAGEENDSDKTVQQRAEEYASRQINEAVRLEVKHAYADGFLSGQAVAYTHPLQGEDKREEAKAQEISSLRWLLNTADEKPNTQLRTALNDCCALNGISNKKHLENLWHRLTTPSNKEGERVEKGALETVKSYLLSFKDQWEEGETMLFAQVTAALATPRKEAVEFAEWFHNYKWKVKSNDTRTTTELYQLFLTTTQ